KDEPERERKQCRKTCVGQDRESYVDPESQHCNSDDGSACDSQRETKKPRRKKRTQDVVGRSSGATGKQKEYEPLFRKRIIVVYSHGFTFGIPRRIESAVRKARSASDESTCVLASTSVERARARVCCAAVTSSKLRRP